MRSLTGRIVACSVAAACALASLLLAACAHTAPPAHQVAGQPAPAAAASEAPSNWSPSGLTSESLGASSGLAGRASELKRAGAGADTREKAGFDRRAIADGGCLPPLNEEVWVIERPGAAARVRSDDVPGCGALVTMLPDAPTQQVPVPLEHTDVQASITGAIGSVEVTQRFVNPFSGKIEAVYVFPLPDNAAVNEFLMTVGDRRIRGIIRERQEAQRIYAEARSQGYVVSLLTQERPNIFTQKVANIEPGKRIDITIRYFHTLAYSEGAFEFVFPMVVGPRFNPPHRTDGVYASPVGSAPAGDPGATNVQYLAPSQRSGHDIGIRVAIETGGAPLGEVMSNSHVVRVEHPSGDEPGRAVVTLTASDTIPNKDFVLRYTLAGDGVRSSAVSAATDSGSYFSMMLVPPSSFTSTPRRPLELVFVLDCSGSMSGEPLSQAKQAVQRALRRLGADDTFQIIRFSNNASTLGPAPLAANPANVRRGLEYLDSLNSEGGTMMIEGIRAALAFPHDPSRFRFVCFLTDGYIGNEDEILGEISRSLGPTRIFSFGIGSSVNRYLMESMARLGRGAVSYAAAGDSSTQTMDAFMERIEHAPMTDIRLELVGMSEAEVYPSRVPDLFAGRPVMIAGRFSGAPGSVRVSANVAGERVFMDVPIRASAGASDASPAALAAVWARHKIADLADGGAASGAAEVAGSIRDVALRFGLMSPYTAFVAVDSSERTEGSFGTTVPVPVPVPQGVRYETTVPGGEAAIRR
jgi:Ca-activated chloride channel family protein